MCGQNTFSKYLVLIDSFEQTLLEGEKSQPGEVWGRLGEKEESEDQQNGWSRASPAH